ncbi:MAG: helix-turn-helix transcriptional regulator [Cypionkella sp.]
MTEVEDVKLTTKHLCQRYNVSTMTIFRWSKDEALNFPNPMRINNRRYWSLASIVEWERTQAARKVPA